MITCVFQDGTTARFHGSAKTFSALATAWSELFKWVTPTPWHHPKRQVSFRLDLVTQMWRD